MAVEIICDPGACWRIPGESWERSWRRMVEMVKLAASAGAQVFKPQKLDRRMYPDGTPAAALVGQYEVPDEWLPRLRDLCERWGLHLLCTVYRAEDVALVDPYVSRWKVASFDNQNPALLDAMLATGKPLLVSLGGTSRQELGALRLRLQHYPVTFLHCVSAYPAPREQMHLAVMQRWSVRWAGAYGLSDHSVGHHAAVMAVALGAAVIEKHVRHDETPPQNPDYAAAASPEDFREYVAAIRQAELLLGDGTPFPLGCELTAYRFDPSTGRRGVPADA